jgi:hypothetical protein
MRCEPGSLLRLDATRDACVLESANISRVENMCEISRGQSAPTMSSAQVVIMISMVVVVLMIFGCCVGRASHARHHVRQVSAEDESGAAE